MKAIRRPPTMRSFSSVFDGHEAFVAALELVKAPTVGGRYVHYEKVRRLKSPGGLSAPQWWHCLKHARRATWWEYGLKSTNRKPFGITTPGVMLEMLHRADIALSRGQGLPAEVLSATERVKYLHGSLAEEAITSSQIEGASTTRRVAVEMIRSGRAPRDGSERMIMNNFRAMSLIQTLAKAPLTPEVVCEIHRTITAGTLAEKAWEGKLRSGEYQPDFGVYDNISGEQLHAPPPPSELVERMQAMCEFANGAGGSADHFVHPIVRAILLHHWLAHDHPFEDGNGRTARALFYGAMLNQGFELCAFISISSLIQKGKSNYARAFMYSETDGGDATYFVLHQLRTVLRAIDALHAHLGESRKKTEHVRQQFRDLPSLNDRQLEVIERAYENKWQRFTARTHQEVHNVVRVTALADLKGLADMGVLVAQKRGKTLEYSVAKDFESRLAGARS